MQELFINGAMIFGTVLGAGKIAMNGLAKSQMRIENKIDKIDARLDEHGERLAGLEAVAGVAEDD